MALIANSAVRISMQCLLRNIASGELQEANTPMLVDIARPPERSEAGGNKISPAPVTNASIAKRPETNILITISVVE